MQNIFSQYGSSAQAPAPSVKTIIRDALAATKKEQNLINNLHAGSKHSKYQLDYIHNQPLTLTQ